jgi:hypothetical protein
VKHRVSRSEAVKRALAQLFKGTQSDAPVLDVYARKFAGSDERPGDVARHSKRLLRERFGLKGEGNVYKSSARFRGHNKLSGDLARHTKRLLRARIKSA